MELQTVQILILACEDVLLAFTQEGDGISWQADVDLFCAGVKQFFFHGKTKMQAEFEPATFSNLKFAHQDLLDSTKRHNGHLTPVSTAPPAQASTSARPASVPEEHPPVRAPLSLVVTDAVKRWYIDTNKEAVKGDVVCDETSGC
ncbi:hypothetical protein WJX77_002861 [Trebouxia sp. C0004]